MKRYEPAGGVCELAWRAGEPHANDQYGDVLIECWTVSVGGWDWLRRPEARVKATLHHFSWDHKQGVWYIGAEQYDKAKHGEVRRWARLSVNYANIPVRIGDW